MKIHHGHFFLRTTRPEERPKKIDVVTLLQRTIKTKLHIFSYWKYNIWPLSKNETLRITVKYNKHKQLLIALQYTRIWALLIILLHFYSHNNGMRKVLLLPLFYRWENWELEDWVIFQLYRLWRGASIYTPSLNLHPELFILWCWPRKPLSFSFSMTPVHEMTYLLLFEQSCVRMPKFVLYRKGTCSHVCWDDIAYWNACSEQQRYYPCCDSVHRDGHNSCSKQVKCLENSNNCSDSWTTN